MKSTILIVDDSKELIDSLRAILKDDYNISTALSAEKALRVLEKVSPDLILLDVVMPGMDGFGFAEVVSEDPEWNKIPIIFISAEKDVYNESSGLELGAVDYVTKPYNEKIVKIKVDNAVENKMRRDKLEHLVAVRTKQVERTRDAVIYGMSLLAEGRDHTTGDHIDRIKGYSEALAKKLHELNPDLLSEADVRNITDLSPVHDIGKVQVPDSILLKPGKLTFEEFEEMKQHTVFGAEVLRKTQENMKSASDDVMRIMVEIAESHHERYDGKGYPLGLKGDEIPVSARIVALADIYDALTSERPYKPAFTHEKAMDIILNGDGRTEPGHFDPKVLEAFRLVADDFQDIQSTYKGGANL